MFISKKEKELLHMELNNVYRIVETLNNDVENMQEALDDMFHKVDLLDFAFEEYKSKQKKTCKK